MVLAVAPAQQPPIDPPRSDYVFHIYVDPIFGDNSRATVLNPSTSPTGVQLRPLDRHPQPPDPNGIKPITGFLQHAPYPFRTLTLPTGALAWIDANFRAGTGVAKFFPWTHPDTEKPRRITQVVVHCLPGLYGPTMQGFIPSPIDAASGLPWNGESWPAVIRDSVCIQGTSALDTIFDARGHFTHVLEVSENRADLRDTGYSSHVQSFIDSVTVRGARAQMEPIVPGSGAGIYMHSRRTADSLASIVRVFVTNCILTDNVVGIALDSFVTPSQGSGVRARILNNTIAWNACGMWCGNSGSAGPSVHAPTVINNIFDSGSPPGWIAGISGFEGLNAGDKQVVVVGAITLTPSNPNAGIDFNAWEVGFVNLGLSPGPGWPSTTAGGSTPWVGPRVDIGPFTRGMGGRPGALYINDIFRNSPQGGTGSEYSPHDFRLAPNVSLTTSPPGAVSPPLRNPLVNAGLDDDPRPLQLPKYPMTMANNWTLLEPPGLSPGAEFSRVDGWDWDGEGLGNPRIHIRSGFTPLPYGPNPGWLESYIDLGFDELGDLTMAGYLASTRAFVKLSVPQGGVTLPDRGQVFYFNLIAAGSPPPPASYPRPLANAPFGIGEAWYQHVQGGSDLEDLNYTLLQALAPGSWRRLVTQLGGYHFSSIPRALRCDFSPSLLLDPHSEWGRLIVVPPFSDDPYAANPWHDDPNSYGFKCMNNPALFHNLGGTIHNDAAPPEPKGLFGLTITAVLDATLNPPGASVLGGGAYVIPPPGGAPSFGPWTPCGGAPGTPYTISTWGYGDAQPGCPDVIPYFGSGSDFLGIRYNCQVGTSDSNLQTFLAVRDAGQGAEASAAGANLKWLPRQPTLIELLDQNTRASLLLEQRWRDAQRKR